MEIWRILLLKQRGLTYSNLPVKYIYIYPWLKENTFFCQYCDYACDRRKRLKDHVDFNHIKKEYPCDICEEHTAKRK